MKGIIKDFIIDNRKCQLYLPAEYNSSEESYPVLYINGGDEVNLSVIMNSLEPYMGIDCKVFLALNVQSENWNEDYSPWPAPALGKNSQAFSGGATKYINLLTQIIKPYMDSNYRTLPEPENTGLIGYSLGGLAAVYALFLNNSFGNIGSMSGSFWYDGWNEYLDSFKPFNFNTRIYLSLGTGEEHSRNPRISKVAQCTKKTAEVLKRQIINSENLIFEWNNGGHFAEIMQRFQRAILWLMR